MDERSPSPEPVSAWPKRQPSSLATLQAVRFASFGVPFRVEVDNPELLPQLPRLLPFSSTSRESTPRIAGLPYLPADEACFTVLSPADGRSFRCVVDGRLCLEHPDREPVLAQLAHELMLHVAEHAPELVFLHAGVVGIGGRALVLPGPSFAGKTTLVAALVRAGAVYLSDEYAVLDSLGRVHPYARQLQMRVPGQAQQRGMDPAELGGDARATAVQGVLPPVLIVFATYREHARWQPEPVSPGMAVLEMMRHTIPVQRAPARVMSALSALATNTSAWRTERDDAGQAAQRLLRMMADLPPHHETPGRELA